MKKTLAIQTSSAAGSVALFQGDQCLYEDSWKRPKGRPRNGEKFLSHSEKVGMSLDEGLKQCDLTVQDIDHFVTSIGPGSFTGIRVGLGAVKAFAFALDKPVFGYESLKTQAYAVEKSETRPILVMLNAYKSQVYCGTYKWDQNKLTTLRTPESLVLEEVFSKLETTHLCLGDGLRIYANLIPQDKKDLLQTPEKDELHEPNAKALGLLHIENPDLWPKSHWKDLNPLYIRSSEAEEKLQQGLLKPVILRT